MSILAAATPPAWVDAACDGWRELLVDHGNCEKKAASSALALIFAYPEDVELGSTLSRLAREELRHFEQVAQLMCRLHVPFERQRPGRYAAGLRRALRQHEPARKLDLMLTGALIEARSCERFGLLAVRLPEPLGGFYRTLAQSEARHFELYLRLAQRAASPARAAVEARLAQLAAVEAELICTPDTQLRFHSGPPGPGMAATRIAPGLSAAAAPV
ncbi:MAG TPA: tRNA-(ms[2]io[6]A)-hydroxylase [Steroidobacteraceae bacterium]